MYDKNSNLPNPEEEHAGISRLANSLKKRQSELIRQAVDEFLIRSNPKDKLARIREAKSMWKDRDNFSLDDLRSEYDRV